MCRRRTRRVVSRSLALAGIVALAAGCSDRTEPPSVILLSVDSLRADHVSAMGRRNPLQPSEPSTPAFDAFAARGVLFENAISSTSWTLPAHASMMTGLPDELHGVLDNFQKLSPELVTLAELFAAKGARTAGYFSGPNVHPAYGFGQGFEQYVDLSHVDADLDLLTDHQSGDLRDLHLASHRAITSPALLNHATAFLERMAISGERFFLFVHWWDPHYDYLAPQSHVRMFVDPSYDGAFEGHFATERTMMATAADVRHLRSLYDAEIRFTDDHIGTLLDRLDALGLGGKTFVAWTADHGEEFYEHGRWGHQRTLYDEVVRIPLAFAGAGVPKGGVRVPGQVRVWDVFTTICDVADLAPPAYSTGRSLRPSFTTPRTSGDPVALRLRVPRMGSPVDLVGVRFDDAKVITDVSADRTVVYDLVADPREQRPIPAERAEGRLATAVERARAELAALELARTRLPGAAALDLPEGLRRQLDAAGYLGGEED